MLEYELFVVGDDGGIPAMKDTLLVGLPLLYLPHYLVFVVNLRYKLFFFIIVHKNMRFIIKHKSLILAAIVGAFAFLLPSQLGKHYFFSFSYLSGIRVDYLAPTLYMTDIIAIILIGIFLLQSNIVIPAQAGIQAIISIQKKEIRDWIPSSEGMTT